MSNFHLLDVVGRGSEAQHQVGENVKERLTKLLLCHFFQVYYQKNEYYHRDDNDYGRHGGYAHGNGYQGNHGGYGAGYGRGNVYGKGRAGYY